LQVHVYTYVQKLSCVNLYVCPYFLGKKMNKNLEENLSENLLCHVCVNFDVGFSLQ